jgi:hypothetical protein
MHVHLNVDLPLFTVNSANGPAGSRAGKAYVVYGGATYGTASAPTPDLSALTAAQGFLIDGAVAGGLTGTLRSMVYTLECSMNSAVVILNCSVV